MKVTHCLYSCLNYCSGENSPVDKNSPTREQHNEDQTGTDDTFGVEFDLFIQANK